MTRRLIPIRLSFVLTATVVCAWLSPAGFSDEATRIAPGEAFFQTEVLPILQANCLKCHGGEDKIRGGLRLMSRETVLQGGDSGPAAVPGNPSESLLVEAINYGSYEMPPDGKLLQEQIDILTRWIKDGAVWPDRLAIVLQHHQDAGPPQVNEQTKQHWAYRPVGRQQIPKVRRTDWVRNPIDAFILARLDEQGLTPMPAATKVTLLRRAYFDLTGLPPSPEEVDAFLRDKSSRAFGKVVDRLLDSPHYGEKWGRHWLDLVRYAETNSYERDGAKPHVWRYRDYVIRSLNEDKPYDQFMREQIAGDELDEITPDSIIATGYYRLGIFQDEPVDPVQELYEDLDDITRTTGEVFLGMTVGCARCHDHKIDPFPQADYYRLLAFFRNMRRYGALKHESVLDASVREIDAPADSPEYAIEIAKHKEKTEDIQRGLTQLEDLVRGKFTGVEKEEFQYEMNRVAIMKRYVNSRIDENQFDEYKNLTGLRDELRKNPPRGKVMALCVKENGPDVPDTFVLVRGNAHVPGDKVLPGFPSVLSPPDPQVKLPSTGASSGRRLALTNWLCGPDNPLTARVMVNRLWQYHFGRGIVRSPNNFGFHGDTPTHPRLLDWLASEFVAGGWKLKRMHRLMMSSATYQMSSRSNAAALAKDPQNNLFWRFDMRRLTAEEIRDSMLAVSGSLNHEVYGQSVYTHIPNEVKAGQSRPGSGWGDSPPQQQNRRSIYIHVKRSLVVPIIAAFDGPDLDTTCPVRFVTTQPTQSLGLMNGFFPHSQAKAFANYLRKQAGDDCAAQVEMALSRAVQRNPTVDEIARGVKLIEKLQSMYKVDARRALEYYCLVVLNLNEFMYLD